MLARINQGAGGCLARGKHSKNISHQDDDDEMG